MTEDEVIERLRVACQNAGGQKAFAQLHNFTPAYVSDVLRGKRSPADRILAAIGLERIVIYQKRRSGAPNVAASVAPSTKVDPPTPS